MDITKLMAKVKKLQIKTNRLVDEMFGGEYHSAFKGKGMEFADLRKYEPGDDYRSIDWKVTARFNSPYVKLYEEERELTIMFVVDISSSMDFASKYQSKKDIASEICAILSLSAVKNKDKVGAVFFDKDISKYIKPDKGLRHALVFLRDLIASEGTGNGSDFERSVDYVLNVQKKKAIVFYISDFIDFSNYKKISLLNRKHDLICIKIKDILEENPPEFFSGLLGNFENGLQKAVSVGDNRMYSGEYERMQQDFTKNMRKYGIDVLEVFTHDDYLKALQKFFRMRARRR